MVPQAPRAAPKSPTATTSASAVLRGGKRDPTGLYRTLESGHGSHSRCVLRQYAARRTRRDRHFQSFESMRLRGVGQIRKGFIRGQKLLQSVGRIVHVQLCPRMGAMIFQRCRAAKAGDEGGHLDLTALSAGALKRQASRDGVGDRSLPDRTIVTGRGYPRRISPIRAKRCSDPLQGGSGAPVAR